MRRDQLEHAIRAACQAVEKDEVIIIGSQAILGTFSEKQLPREATMSLEVDVLPVSDDEQEAVEMADLLAAVAGEFSKFEEHHGFSIDGVDLHTAKLPEGWRGRLSRVQNANTAHPSGTPQFIGWCLESHDLCAAKLCALREKDLNFVSTLLDAGLVDADTIEERLRLIPARHKASAGRASVWLRRNRP
jgi:hypothetical protein